MIDGKYRKLSDLLQHTVAIGVKDEIIKMYPNGDMPSTVRILIENKKLFYSKKIHGDNMIRNIEPDNFFEQCNIFFKPAFIRLKEFNG